MANIKSAQKKLKQDLVRSKLNLLYKNRYQKAIKLFMAKPSQKLYQSAASSIDKAAKKNIIDKNKASRLKAKIAAKLKK
jgi:small subunit ribosomal protein S20